MQKKGIEHVVKNHGDVLLRFHSNNLPMVNNSNEKIDILKMLRGLNAGEIFDSDVLFNLDNGSKIKCRICAILKSPDAIEKEVKRIIKNASKKQRKVKAETLEFAKYIIAFTTVDRHQMTASDVMEIYRARWQTELAFKRMKSIMSLGHLPKRDQLSCKAWLYGKMLLAQLVKIIHREAEFFPLGGIQCRDKFKPPSIKYERCLWREIEYISLTVAMAILPRVGIEATIGSWDKIRASLAESPRKREYQMLKVGNLVNALN